MTSHANDNSGNAAIRAPFGPQISCKGWQQEAALRMLMNVFDERVGGYSYLAGLKADQDWGGRDEIVSLLKDLGNDETLLVQSGKPAGIFKTDEGSPRVLILHFGEGKAAQNATEEFNAAEFTRPMMEGALAFGSWTYSGVQEVIHHSYQTLAAIGEEYFGGDLAGKLIVNCGMGRSGGVQSMAAVMNGAAFLGIDVDPEQIKKQLKMGQCDFMVNTLDEALRILKNALRKKENVSVGLVANCADVVPELAERGVLPDILTDQICDGAPLNGCIPNGMTLAEALSLRARDPEDYEEKSAASARRHLEGKLRLGKMGAVAGSENINSGPEVQQRRMPFRWFALSGDPADIYTGENILFDLFPENRILRRWVEMARKRIKFQGLPSRICWLNQTERVRFGLAIHQLVKHGKVKAPIVIGSDHLEPWSAFPPGLVLGNQDSAASLSLASSPLKESFLTAAAGSSWLSIQTARGTKTADRGPGTLIYVGRAVLADGMDAMTSRIESALV